MRTTIVMAITLLMGAAAGGSQRVPPPSRTLDLSIAIESTPVCRNTGPGDGDTVTLGVRLGFRNRATAPIRVLPDTVRLASVQIVRTVEEIVPLGADTPGITVGAPHPDAKGPSRLVAPGESIDVVRTLTLAVARRLTGTSDGFEPGHYFLELIGVVETAAPGSRIMRAESVVSPYIGIDIPSSIASACPSA